ncbi:Alpha/Beta hydrolase protein [Lenzites betulinus]|nr:Alpha/Beta hydrolase protein [Lenzites betulinus]
MDPEFAEAFAKDERFKAGVSLDAPKDSNKSPIDLVREQAAGLVQAAVSYHEKKLPPASTYTAEDKTIAVENGAIRARCVIPVSAAADATFPVLVWFHSGGWVVGNPEQDDNHLRSVAVELQIAIVNVDYRLAPEHPFPTGLNDAYAALKWAADNAAELHVSLSKGFIVGGDSAGANIATTCAHLARDDAFFAGRPLTGQLVREPAVVHPHACPPEYQAELQSLELFKDGPLLTKEALLQCRALLQAPPAEPRISPLLFPSHAGLPPIFLTYNGADPLRDDGKLWARVLREAGVAVKDVLYPGVPHGFYYSFPAIGLAKKADQDLRDGLKWLLAGGKD